MLRVRAHHTLNLFAQLLAQNGLGVLAHGFCCAHSLVDCACGRVPALSIARESD
jgi:hypothetical protein